MSLSLFLFILAILLGLYMAWNIGSNDVANSMASAVGAKAITLRQAIFIASILTFLGATLVGSHVTNTIRKGIVDPFKIGEINSIIIGLLSALLSAGLWITYATQRGWPVSTTHSIVGAVVGFGIAASGGRVINWYKLWQVTLSWILSPVFSGLLAFFVFKLIIKLILEKKRPSRYIQNVTCVFIFLAFLVVFFSLFSKTNLGKKLDIITAKEIIFYSIIISIIFSFIGYILVRMMLNRGKKTEDIFRVLQVMTSCYVAFAHGANDVANAIGPVAGIFSIIKTGALKSQIQLPIYLLALGGAGIAIGITTWGYKVIATVGDKITHLTNTRGFCIDFSAATSVLIASKLGMPVSTTHAVVGAVCGVGLARGLAAVDFRIVKKIIYSWFLTIPVAIVLTILFYRIIRIIL